MTNCQRRPTLRAPRGVSLIEGLAASAVLLLGLVGVLQGVVFASTQNSMAGRLTRAGAINQQMIAGLQSRGRARLVDAATGIFKSGTCITAPPSNSTVLQGGTVEAVGDLYPKPPGLAAPVVGCYVDLDAYDTAATAANKIMPGYDAVDASVFKRSIVYFADPADTALSWVGVVTSWKDGGRIRTMEQFFTLYDPAVNQTGVEL